MSRTALVVPRLREVFSIDLRSIALFRVMLSSVLLLDLALRSADLATFYTDRGVLSRATLLEIGHRFHWSLHAASGELWWQALLFVIAALTALALLVGYRTRAASVLSFVLLASLLNRNPLVLQGGDQLLVVITFWAMFLPLGARFSIDAALDPARRDDPNRVRFAIGAPQPWFSVATVAVILQVLYLYTFTALLKTGDAWTSRFDAAYYAVSLQHFATPIGAWFSQFPGLLKVATVYVLGVEFIAPLLVLAPLFWPWLRLAGLAMLVSLHIAFALMLHIGLFPLIDLTALSLLLPSAVWIALDRLRRRGAEATRAGENAPRTPVESLVIHYDHGCDFCLKTCLILRELLLPERVRIVPAQASPAVHELMQRENSWVVTDIDGRRHVHWGAMAVLFRRSLLLKPIGWLMSLPPLRALGDRLYRLVATHRETMGRFSARFLPWRPVRPRATLVGAALAAFFLVAVTLFNVNGLPGLSGSLPAPLERAVRSVRLDQRWDMFAPFPLTVSIYPLIPGELRDGTAVDVYPLTSSADDWALPARFYPLYESYRWRKYLGRVDRHRSDAVRRSFGNWLCRQWNGQPRERETQLATLQIHFVKHRTNTDGRPKEISRNMVWRHWCYAEFAPREGA